jgi:hypothetical protein
MKFLIPLVHALAADGSFLAASQVGNPSNGLTALANADSFNNTNFSIPLTSYAQGWRDPTNIDEILEFLFPGVQVANKFQWYKHDTEADFLIDTDDARAPGADFKQVKASGSIVDSSTVNKGLTMFVDMDEVRTIPNWEQLYTARLLRRCKRNDLYSAIMLLVAGASNANKVWDGASDPDNDLMTMIDDGGDALGFNPNRLAFLGKTWNKRNLAYRVQDTAGARASLMLRDVKEVADYCGAMEGMKINNRVKIDGAAKGKIGGNYVIAFYAEAGVGPEDPSTTKRFWSPCEGGEQYRVYVDRTNPKFSKITVERYNRMVVTSTLGAKKLTVG